MLAVVRAASLLAGAGGWATVAARCGRAQAVCQMREICARMGVVMDKQTVTVVSAVLIVLLISSVFIGLL